uniref:Conserved hypothetical plastid protein n=1 Tax=Corynoplastis japonica TaxID=700918 RepID=A0A1X9PTR4_9RHOD|nr:conserved hypothetical plastid protein [Corynoplastis japonica]
MHDSYDPILGLTNIVDLPIINKQLALIDKINTDNTKELLLLVDVLAYRKNQPDWYGNCVDGLIYETLYKTQDITIQNFLTKELPDGVVKLKSDKNMNYQDLQILLVNKQLQEANQLTQKKLCELAEVKLANRDWLYFTDIQALPNQDLITIDNLWKAHSRGRFGFSNQRQIWLNVNKNWNELWKKLGWKINDNLCRYPNEFIWDLNAPKGHLPLFNQLRGVQVLSSLFDNPIWENQ